MIVVHPPGSQVLLASGCGTPKADTLAVDSLLSSGSTVGAAGPSQLPFLAFLRMDFKVLGVVAGASAWTVAEDALAVFWGLAATF